jgi:hypothetical protein
MTLNLDSQVDDLWRTLSKLQKTDPQAYLKLQQNLKNQEKLEKENYEKSKELAATKIFDVLVGKMKKFGYVNDKFVVKICENGKAP